LRVDEARGTRDEEMRDEEMRDEEMRKTVN
jgi:hypothetical protein